MGLFSPRERRADIVDAHTPGSIWTAIAIFCVILAVVVVAQIVQDAYRSDLARHPDEAAHLVSAACVLDYFRTSFASKPTAFAEWYYVHYPKVALGHWPPMFYVLQAAWYAVFGVTTSSAILMMAVICAGAIAVLFFRVWRLCGLAAALLSSAVFFSLPLVRMSPLVVMSDMLASLFTLLAILALCDAQTFGRRRMWLAFGLWTVAAILTKESAAILLLIAPLAVILDKGKRPTVSGYGRRLAVFCGLLTVVVLLLYTLTGVWKIRGIPSTGGFAGSWRRLSMLASFFEDASVLVFVSAAYQAFRSFGWRTSPKLSESATTMRIAFLWLVVAITSQLFFRQDALETRYFLPACFPLILLFAGSLDRVQRFTLRRFGSRALAISVAAAVATVAIASSPGVQLRQRTGYAAVASSIPYSGSPAVLVSSDSLGEGAMVVARLAGDSERAGTVLRASKVLSSSNWMGDYYTPLVNSVDGVQQLLDRVPVQFIVIDINGFIDQGTRRHHRLLEETVRRNPAQFPIRGDFPLVLNGDRREHAVQIYENLRARGRRPDTIRIDMTSTLGRSLNVSLSEFKPAMVPRPIVTGAFFRKLAPIRRSQLRFGIAPGSDTIGSGGGSGRISVTAPAGLEWSVAGASQWISLSDTAGSGDGMIRYEVEANRTNERRSAVLTIGSERFTLTQPRSAYTYLPFFENFRELPLPLWQMRDPDPYAASDPPCRWYLDDHSGQNARVRITSEGPEGSACLVIEKPHPDPDAWKTQVWLPRLEVEEGARYTVSVWLKADGPSVVRLTLGQRTAPYRLCGFSTPLTVGPAWKEYQVSFGVAGDGCGAENNRFAFEAGAVAGKLSIARFSLVAAPAK